VGVHILSSTILQDNTDTKSHPSTIKWHNISFPECEKPPSDIIAVLPAINEELVIGSVILSARKYVERVIVVDDGSSDCTAEIALLAGAEVIRLDQNNGKACALMLGFRQARERGCKVAVMLDSDGQHDPREITQVARPVLEGKADLVIGSRFLETKNDVPLYRKVGQKTLDLLTNISANSKVTDSQSGFRALSCKALDNMDFQTDGYNIESDMINHFASIGLNIIEVPISITYDVPNKHKMHPVLHGLGVMSRLVNLISYRRPLLTFGIPGLVLTMVGLITEIWVFTEFYTNQVFHYIVALGSGIILIVGILFVISGLILNTLVLIMKES